MSFEQLILVLIVAIFSSVIILKIIKKKQLEFIEKYRFNSAIGKKILQRYPHLTQAQVQQVLEALRDYFFICKMAKRRMTSMPSQVVDVAWHEFILFTHAYQSFCKKAFGRFLHHTPAEAMHTPTMAQGGIKRTWRLACVRSNINQKKPTQLPLLFAIDEELNIEDGFKYALNCKDKSSTDSRVVYCATSIGCTSCSSSIDGDGGFGSCSSCGGGCGGGD